MSKRVRTRDDTLASAQDWSEIEALYDQFPSMVRLAVLLTGSLAVAEDVVQEAFLHVAPKYGALANPGGYLRVAVVNGCRRYGRDRSRRQGILERTQRSDLYEDQRLVDFMAALGGLRQKERAVVALRYYCDVPDEEIAQVLRCPPATVRTLARRALLRLRKEMNQ